MLSLIYKLALCIFVALCIRESWDFVVNDVVPNSHITLIAMTVSILLLIERLYILLWLENNHTGKM